MMWSDCTDNSYLCNLVKLLILCLHLCWRDWNHPSVVYAIALFMFPSLRYGLVLSASLIAHICKLSTFTLFNNFSNFVLWKNFEHTDALMKSTVIAVPWPLSPASAGLCLICFHPHLRSHIPSPWAGRSHFYLILGGLTFSCFKHKQIWNILYFEVQNLNYDFLFQSTNQLITFISHDY